MARKLDITIVEAQLVRIFDSLKPNQDVFVQLVCGYADGKEKVVGRTETCKNGNFRPKWNERFLCGRDTDSGSRTLKFRVNIDHLWRNSVLCGEAEFSLDNLWSRALGGPQRVQVPLFKRGEQTGVLSISMALDNAGQSPAGPAADGHPDLPLKEQEAALNGSGATGAPTPGGASVGTPYFTPAGTPYGTPAGDGLRIGRGRSPMGVHHYEFTPPTPMGAAQSPGQGMGYPVGARLPTPQAAGGHSPARGAFQQSPQATDGRSPSQQTLRVPTQTPTQQGAQPPAMQRQSVDTPPLQPRQTREASKPEPQPGKAAQPEAVVYATGASGQWWNSFIDRG